MNPIDCVVIGAGVVGLAVARALEVMVLEAAAVIGTGGAWRGRVVPKVAPDPIVTTLKDMARKAGNEASFKETLEKTNLGYSYAEGDVFLKQILADREMFKGILAKLDVNK